MYVPVFQRQFHAVQPQCAWFRLHHVEAVRLLAGRGPQPHVSSHRVCDDSCSDCTYGLLLFDGRCDAPVHEHTLTLSVNLCRLDIHTARTHCTLRTCIRHAVSGTCSSAARWRRGCAPRPTPDCRDWRSGSGRDWWDNRKRRSSHSTPQPSRHAPPAERTCWRHDAHLQDTCCCL